MLGRDFIDYVFEQVKPQLGVMAPSAGIAEEAFRRMGSRPEERMKALNVLRTLPQGANPNEHLPTTAQAFGAAAADIELQKIEAIGPLAQAVFSRICSIGGDVKGMFTADALKEYSSQIGRETTAQEVQGVIGLMTSANLLMRVKHGHYGVTDSFVNKPGDPGWRPTRSCGQTQPPDAYQDTIKMIASCARSYCLKALFYGERC